MRVEQVASVMVPASKAKKERSRASSVFRIRGKRGNLKTVLKRLPAPELGKDQLALALWPILKSRLDSHRAADTLEAIPVYWHLRKAVELASISFRRHIGMNY